MPTPKFNSGWFSHSNKAARKKQKHTEPKKSSAFNQMPNVMSSPIETPIAQNDSREDGAIALLKNIKDYEKEPQEPKIDPSASEGLGSSGKNESDLKQYTDAQCEKENSYSRKAAEQDKKICDQNIAHYEGLKEQTQDLQAREEPHKFILKPEFTSEISQSPRYLIYVLFFIAFAGFAVIGTTYASVIFGGHKLELVEDYPFIAAIFAFIPISLMIWIGHCYGQLRQGSERKTYRHRISWVAVILVVPLLLTFIPAYDLGINFSDVEPDPLLEEDSGYGFLYTIHLTLQIFFEIVIGGIIKTMLIDHYRSDREIKPVLDECFNAITQHIAYLNSRIAFWNNQSRAIQQYIDNNEAVKQIVFVEALIPFNAAKKVADAKAQIHALESQLAAAKSILSTNQKDAQL